ncbi:unnamed protein product [Aphis gossypii]|uniref:Uncharacterized protein n=1 Tax=Aphis gossypii TaxID=80765 RepID=A0A9P0J8C8_APHGO|nr:unnamed protein product [Aphis gossypii]
MLRRCRLLDLARVGRAVGVDAAAVMVAGRSRLDDVLVSAAAAAARLLRLEQFLERYDTGQDQRDFAHQQRLSGHQGDDLQRHRAHDAGGHHAGHHHGLLHGLVLLLATTFLTGGSVQHDGPGRHEPVHAAGQHVVQQGALAVGVRGGVQGGPVGPVGLRVRGLQRLAGPGGQRHSVHDGQGGLAEGPVQRRQSSGLEAHRGRVGRVAGETVVQHGPQDRAESGGAAVLLLWRRGGSGGRGDGGRGDADERKRKRVRHDYDDYDRFSVFSVCRSRCRLLSAS